VRAAGLRLERISIPCRRGRGDHPCQAFAHYTSSHAAENRAIECRSHRSGSRLASHSY
jgi:hypothetical protein